MLCPPVQCIPRVLLHIHCVQADEIKHMSDTNTLNGLRLGVEVVMRNALDKASTSLNDPLVQRLMETPEYRALHASYIAQLPVCMRMCVDITAALLLFCAKRVGQRDVE